MEKACVGLAAKCLCCTKGNSSYTLSGMTCTGNRLSVLSFRLGSTHHATTTRQRLLHSPVPFASQPSATVLAFRRL